MRMVNTSQRDRASRRRVWRSVRSQRASATSGRSPLAATAAPIGWVRDKSHAPSSYRAQLPRSKILSSGRRAQKVRMRSPIRASRPSTGAWISVRSRSSFSSRRHPVEAVSTAARSLGGSSGVSRQTSSGTRAAISCNASAPVARASGAISSRSSSEASYASGGHAKCACGRRSRRRLRFAERSAASSMGGSQPASGMGLRPMRWAPGTAWPSRL